MPPPPSCVGCSALSCVPTRPPPDCAGGQPPYLCGPTLIFAWEKKSVLLDIPTPRDLRTRKKMYEYILYIGTHCKFVFSQVPGLDDVFRSIAFLILFMLLSSNINYSVRFFWTRVFQRCLSRKINST